MKNRFLKLIKSRFFQSALIAALFLAVGIFIGINSWNKRIYVQLKPGGEGRYVASEGETEIVSLSLEEYREQIQKKIFGHTKVTEGEKFKEFYLGNFLVQEGGEHQRICQAYSFLEMRFTALNVSLSGSPGEMVIQAPCQAEEEEFIGPFAVPLKEILNNPEKEFFSLEDRETFIRFYNTAIALTESWLLTAVRFFNSPEESGFVVRFIPGEEADAFELNFQ